jgi:hypothetical protein
MNNVNPDVITGVKTVASPQNIPSMPPQPDAAAHNNVAVMPHGRKKQLRWFPGKQPNAASEPRPSLVTKPPSASSPLTPLAAKFPHSTPVVPKPPKEDVPGKIGKPSRPGGLFFGGPAKPGAPPKPSAPSNFHGRPGKPGAPPKPSAPGNFHGRPGKPAFPYAKPSQPGDKKDSILSRLFSRNKADPPAKALRAAIRRQGKKQQQPDAALQQQQQQQKVSAPFQQQYNPSVDGQQEAPSPSSVGPKVIKLGRKGKGEAVDPSHPNYQAFTPLESMPSLPREFEKKQDTSDNQAFTEKYIKVLDVFKEDLINYGKLRLDSYQTFRDNLMKSSTNANKSTNANTTQIPTLSLPTPPEPSATKLVLPMASPMIPPPPPALPADAMPQTDENRTMAGGGDFNHDTKVMFEEFKKHANSVLDRYMDFHKKFLKSFGRRLKHLWRYSPDKVSVAIQKLFTDAIDPFYKGYAAITNSAQLKGSENDMFVHNMLSSVIERANTDREKLYDFYNNNLSSMDLLFNMTFVTMYALKLIRACIIFGALFLASRTFQARYVSKVFANNEDPPNLLMFVVMYVVIETIFMVFLVIIMFLMKRVMSALVDEQIYINFLVDYAVSSVIIVILGLLLSMIVMKKKYFRYKSDGLRAIRSLQEMMFYVSFVVLLFPYYVLNVG